MSGHRRLQGPGETMRGEARCERATNRIVRKDARVGARGTVCRAERESERWGSRRGRQSRGDQDAEDCPHRCGSASALLCFHCLQQVWVQNGGHSCGWARRSSCLHKDGEQPLQDCDTPCRSVSVRTTPHCDVRGCTTTADGWPVSACLEMQKHLLRIAYARPATELANCSTESNCGELLGKRDVPGREAGA